MTDVVWTRDALIANAESLLALDAKGALTPHGIGHLAREIITGFLDLARDADPLPDADGWVKHTPGPCPVDPETVVEVRLRSGYEEKGGAANEARCWFWDELGAGTITHYRIVRPAPLGPVVEETEPKRSPLGWYYQADPKSRSVSRCKLGQAWERMEFTDLEPDAAELRFIADVIESAARQIGEAMEGK